MMRFLTLILTTFLLCPTTASAFSPPCDDSTTAGTGDICSTGAEEGATQSYKLSFLDDKTGWACTTATGGTGSMWIAHDFDANPDIGPLPVICVDDADMDPDLSLRIIPRGTLKAAARRPAGIETTDTSEYSCAGEADEGRVVILDGADPPTFTWCHWDGSAAHSQNVALGDSEGLPQSIGTTAAADTTCDATGTFTNGDTIITLADYDNTGHKSIITATISFTAVTAATFTITAKMEGSQIGTDVTCSAAVGFKTSCTISVLDPSGNDDRTFTITASQSAGVLNTVDTCNVTRLTVLG